MSFAVVTRILSRIAEAVLTMFMLALVTFLLMKALPGGPFDHETSLHPLVREKLTEQWKLNDSTAQQFASYLGGILRGDLGWSMAQPGRSVVEILKTGFSRTLWMNLAALVFVLIAAPMMAALALWRPLRTLMESVLLALISLPGLFLGPFLIWLFAFQFDLLPAALLETPAHYVLPVLTLALRPAASVTRLLLGSLRDIESADFLRTAKAKGLTELRIFWKHALRNSLIPALAYLGPVITGLLSGSFIVEVLFSTQGLGMAFVEALGERDLPVVMGLTLFYGFLLLVLSLIVDLLTQWIDPRTMEG